MAKGWKDLTINLKRRENMGDTLVVNSKVKKIVKEKGFRTGGDYLTALSKKVEEIVNSSVNKVMEDGKKKKTLGAEDL